MLNTLNLVPFHSDPIDFPIDFVVSMFVVSLIALFICRRIEQTLENNIFDTAEVIGVDAKGLMESKAVIVRRPTNL